MTDTSRWDPEMLAARQRLDAEAAKYPPVVAREPFDLSREVTEIMGEVFGSGGPVMALADRAGAPSDEHIFSGDRAVA